MIITEYNLEKFTQIDIKTALCSIEFVESSSYGLEVYTNTQSNVEWSNKNGRLCVVEGREWFNLHIGVHKNYVKIFMPKAGALTNVTLKCSVGSIKADKLNVDVFSINCELGQISLTEINAKTITALSTSGSFLGNNITADSIDQKSNLGNCEFNNIKCNTLISKSNAGNIIINGGEFNRLDSNANLGKIKGTNVVAHKLNAICKSGSIDLIGSFDIVDVRSDLGKVAVKTNRPQNDYAVMLKTELGEVTVNNSKVGNHYTSCGANNFTAKSKCGKVAVSFG